MRRVSLVFGLEVIRQGPGGKLGEGLVGRREDGEWSLACEGVGQAGGLEGFCQGGERAGGDRRRDDVLLLRPQPDLRGWGGD